MAQLEHVRDGGATTQIVDRWLTSIGKLKVEIVNLYRPTGGSDWFVTRIQNPIGFLARASTDADSGNVCCSITRASQGGKRITVDINDGNQADVAGTPRPNIGVIVFGY